MTKSPHAGGPATGVARVRELYAYNRWANERILDAAATLGPEAFARDLATSHRSVRDTLRHILGGEWLWLRRWQGVSPTEFELPEALPDVAALRVHWDEVESEREAFFDRLTDADLEARLAYKTMAGEPHVQPLWQLLHHVVNHSTYHRGQVVTLLRQLGGTAPWTDLAIYFRERTDAPTALGS